MELIVKKYIKYTSMIVLMLLSLQTIAATVSDAIIASENNNSAKAVEILSQLAGTGNSVAQYNLASRYSEGNGVQQNKVMAEQWLKDAARSGLIEAYVSLNNEAISPGNGQYLRFQVGPDAWLNKQASHLYTIQLASSRNKKSIIKSYDENNLKGKGGYYHYVKGNTDRYILVYGAYKTVAAANIAINKLPAKLLKKTPWVRKIKSIKNITK